MQTLIECHCVLEYASQPQNLSLSRIYSQNKICEIYE